jgi:hypothetical protein
MGRRLMLFETASLFAISMGRRSMLFETVTICGFYGMPVYAV